MLRTRRRRVKAVSYDTPLSNSAGDENLYFEMPDNGSNPEQKVLESSFSEDLQKALNALSPEQRLLITLADVEGVAYKEIAEILGKPVGTIRSRLHRTHKAIRARLDQIRRESQPGTQAPQMRLAPSH